MFRRKMYEIKREIGTCSPGGGYVVLPEEKVNLDLEKLKDIIKKEGLKIKFSSHLMITITHPKSDVDISFYNSGKILFKTYDKDKIDDFLNEVEPFIHRAKKN